MNKQLQQQQQQKCKKNIYFSLKNVSFKFDTDLISELGISYPISHLLTLNIIFGFGIASQM